MNKLSYSDLVLACKMLAGMLESIVEVKEYTEYGWVSIAFMTDRFGGCYTNLHYDLGTGELSKDYGTDKEFDIDSLCTLYKVVKNDMERMLEARDLDYISECVNSEYN